MKKLFREKVKVATPVSDDHGLLPVSLYLKIFGILLAMIFLSVGVAKLLALSMLTTFFLLFVIATVQAFLVAVFFMELVHEDRFYSVTFASGILFIILFMTVSLLELHGRDFFETVEGIRYKRDVHQDGNYSPNFKHSGASVQEKGLSHE